MGACPCLYTALDNLSLASEDFSYALLITPQIFETTLQVYISFSFEVISHFLPEIWVTCHRSEVNF